ncbi:hypothetical protein XK97_03860 [Obesumbacterium proteus]|nr:hypothetical protein XK97_03860 [Obesumbacterium proteus]
MGALFLRYIRWYVCCTALFSHIFQNITYFHPVAQTFRVLLFVFLISFTGTVARFFNKRVSLQLLQNLNAGEILPSKIVRHLFRFALYQPRAQR